jgi:hypothetical protein
MHIHAIPGPEAKHAVALAAMSASVLILASGVSAQIAAAGGNAS